MERPRRIGSLVRDAHFAAAARKLVEMGVETREVVGSQRARVYVERLRRLKVLETAHSLERKSEFVVVANLNRNDLVMPEAQMVERLQKRLRIREEVADKKDDASPRDALGDLMEHAGHVGLAAGLQRVEPLKDAAHLRRLGLRGNEIAYLRVIRDEADGVLLVDEKIRKRGGDVLPVL